MDLGGEEAAEHHGATQTDRDAHGSGLHLYKDVVVLTGSDECVIIQLAHKFVSLCLGN